ncbi:hypothetical protein EZN00_00048 [Clostridium tyrobutyricum]|jgi:ABC-2 type transport system ATP-binding protein|nr:hypothetical protein EZN00_00048 [Clostridium tyrobutyricum]
MYFLTAIKFSTPHFLFINKIPSLKNAAIRLKIRGKNISQKFGFTHEHDDVYSKSILGDKEANTIIKGILTGGGEIYEAVQKKWSLEELYFKYIKGMSDNPIL